MNKISEAQSNTTGTLQFNGWVLTIVSGLIITGTGLLVTNVITNDIHSRERDAELQKQVSQLQVIVADLKWIAADINEIKQILKRTTPFERK